MRTLSILTFSLALALAGPLAAQPSAESKAAAEALFDEGKKLMDGGDYGAACPKFEQSEALDPALGTALNLAGCYEKIGRTASAWATFRRAAAVAKAKKQADREKLARKRADALEANLSRLTIVVPEASRVTGLSVTRNGVAIGSELFGQAVPVDPGTFSIEASAPGKVTFKTQVELATKANQSVTIPVLENDTGAAASTEPAPPPVAPVENVPPVEPPPTELDQPPADADTGSSQRTIGLVVGGAGVVGLVVAGVFALKAKSTYDDSKAECLPADPNRCSPKGVELRDDARSSGNVATIAGGLGLAALVGGSILYFTAPAPKSTGFARPHVGVGFTPAGPSFALHGAW
jgi:serine/threonine-protein kinase